MLALPSSSTLRLRLLPTLAPQARSSTRRCLSHAAGAGSGSSSGSGSGPSSSSSASSSSSSPSAPTPPQPSPAAQPKRLTHAERDALLRASLLERDGGPASVPTRGGSWDSELGPNTSRSLFRVLDQVRSGTGAESVRERRHGKSAVDGWKMPSDADAQKGQGR